MTMPTDPRAQRGVKAQVYSWGWKDAKSGRDPEPPTGKYAAEYWRGYEEALR